MAQDGPNRKRRHSPQEIERGLTAVAQADGNTRTAAEQLAQQGESIPRSTLRNWLRQHPQLYKRLIAQVNTPAQGTEGDLRPEARTQANGNRASVLARAGELIAQRLDELDRERQELEQRLDEITGGRP